MSKIKKTMVKTPTRKLSRTSVVDMINATKGRFFTATFTKKNGEMRTINGNRKGISPLGYIMMNVPKVGVKSIDPRTLVSVKIAGMLCIIK